MIYDGALSVLAFVLNGRMKTFHFVSHYGLHLDSQKRSPNVYRGNEQAIIAPARFSGAWSGEEGKWCMIQQWISNHRSHEYYELQTIRERRVRHLEFGPP